MTIIEFFDNTSIENIASALLCNPDKVIILGDNDKRIKKYISLYKQITKNRGLNVDFLFKKINRNNLSNIINVLTEIVENNPNCIFDLEGGEDLFLVAVGYIYNKFGDIIKLHRFNVRNNSLTDCDSDGKIVQTAPIEISVEENVQIYAGKIITEFLNGFQWDFNDDFIDDLELMWQICKEDSKEWNLLSSALTAAGERCFCDNSIIISKETAGVNWKAKTKIINFKLLKRLYSIGLLDNLIITEEKLQIDFKNEQIKKTITKSGQLLELYITEICQSLKDENGHQLYNDIKTGVVLDWDGFYNDGVTKSKILTINEIDIMLMKGLVPVFISCKNGAVDKEELYKLSTVAERFGGKYAKKVLLASDLDASNENHKAILARANDMKIRIIDDAADLSRRDLEKTIASLWSN